MTVGRSLRGTRAAVLAAVCVALSAAGHVWMSGRGIPPWSLALAFALVAGCGYALAGRQRGPVPIGALMLAGEWAQHLLYTAAQGPAPLSALQQRMLQTYAVLPPSARRIPTADWICGMTGMGSGSLSTRLAADLMAGHGFGMIAAHGAAGLLSAWWLWRGESAAFRLLRWASAHAVALPALVRFAAAPVPDEPAARLGAAPAEVRVPARSLLLLSAAVVRRGPPSPRFSL
jgi:hypothetical protein